MVWNLFSPLHPSVVCFWLNFHQKTLIAVVRNLMQILTWTTQIPNTSFPFGIKFVSALILLLMPQRLSPNGVSTSRVSTDVVEVACPCLQKERQRIPSDVSVNLLRCLRQGCSQSGMRLKGWMLPSTSNDPIHPCNHMLQDCGSSL